jgi:hypothetical protein
LVVVGAAARDYRACLGDTFRDDLAVLLIAGERPVDEA